jgi:hypothetical protein
MASVETSRLEQAAQDVLLGASLHQVFQGYRSELLAAVGLQPHEADKKTFVKEAMRFLNKLCRHLADRHAGDRRALAALLDWVALVREYEAWDSLLSAFRFDGRERWVERGRQLFAGPMTAHW